MTIDRDLINQFEYLGCRKWFSRIVCVSEYSLIKEDKLRADAIDLIQNLIEKNYLPILNLSVNPINARKYLDIFLQYFDPDKFFVLSCDSRLEHNLDINLAHWPFCLLFLHNVKKDYSLNFHKTYRIGSLMRHTRLHRLALLQSIKPWVTHKDVVVANLPILKNIPIDVQESPEAMSWIQNLPYTNDKKFLDLEESSHTHFEVYTIDHPAYKAMVNITNESWYKDDALFITEKTWKAYLNKCLVINYGSTDMPNRLENFGLKIWKEFDHNIDYQSKIKVMVDLFQRQDIADIYNDNLELVDHNYQLVTSQDFAKKLAMPALEKIQQLL